MIRPDVAARFRDRQRRTISDMYDQAWQAGVDGYTPDPDPPIPTPREQHPAQDATLVGTALLAARRGRAYLAPDTLDAARRAQALVAAYAGVDRMVVELAGIAPTTDHLDAAAQAVTDGTITADAAAGFATGLAVSDWAASNAWRLDAGESVAWAGEQAGYAEAADSDGQLVAWQTSGDDAVCVDCDGLEALGPMPLEDFPTAPGDGATVCDVGCRCSWEAVPLLPGDEFLPPADTTVIDRVAGQAADRADQLTPDMAVLE